jgi:hypothetical protein
MRYQKVLIAECNEVDWVQYTTYIPDVFAVAGNKLKLKPDTSGWLVELVYDEYMIAPNDFYEFVRKHDLNPV